MKHNHLGVKLFVGLSTLLPALEALAIPRSWDSGGSGGLWSTAINWTPDGVPQPVDDLLIGNLISEATVFDLPGTTTHARSLALTASSSVDTNGREMIIDGGATTLGGAGTFIIVRPNSTSSTFDALDVDSITINSGALLRLEGGIVEVDAGLLEINAGGVLGGFGRIDLEHNSGGSQVFENSGQITVTSPNPGVVPGTLTIQIAGPGTGTIDLDGDSENGVVDVSGNGALTLIINGPIDDTFNGTLRLGASDRLQIASAWALGSGATLEALANGQSTIAGGTMTQSGGTINVGNDSILLFEAPFVQSGGTLSNSGHVRFNQNATIGAAANFLIADGHATITVGANAVVTVNQPNFDADGILTSTINIENAGLLDLNLGAGADETLSGLINLSGGELDVTTIDDTWGFNGVMNVGAGISTIDGEHLTIASADLNINAGRLVINSASVSVMSNVDIAIAAAAELDINTPSSWNSNTISVTGAGTFRPGDATIAVPGVVWSAAVLDWDDGDQLLNSGSSLTINANQIDSAADGFDAVLTVNSATVTVNTPSPWRMEGTLHLNNTGFGAPTVAGARMIVADTDTAAVNVSGDATLSAAVTFGENSTTQIAAGAKLLLNGGDNAANLNRIAGGTIAGAGVLGAGDGHSLHGFGNIQGVAIDFDGAADLRADDGTLTINGGAILDARNIGTADNDGILHVVHNWNSSGVTNVSLAGGQLTGGTLTIGNSLGLRGRGLVTARVINNTTIEASGGTLILQTPGNDNLWDGNISGSAGSLRATSGTLELRGTGQSEFNGILETANAASTVLMNGFTLVFAADSQIRLHGGALRSINTDPMTSSTTRIRGQLEVANATSRIDVPRLLLQEGSATTLAADLELDTGYTAIFPTATVSGPGTLINLPDGLLRILAPEIGARIYNQGLLDFGDVLDTEITRDTTTFASGFVQSGIGTTRFVINGAEHDRLFTTHAVDLAGTLSVVVDSNGGMFSGIEYELIAANDGIFGQYQSYEVSSLNTGDGSPVGWTIAQTSKSLSVRVGIAGDFNDDGLVNAADYVIWRKALGSNALIPNDRTPGTVTLSDYNDWRTNHGRSISGAGTFANSATSLSEAVPEPATLLIASMLAACLISCRAGDVRSYEANDRKRLQSESRNHFRHCSAND